ncbi:MAG: sodium/solute symporter [Proteobacteria bacterium]|nr:sodium/solute symporter [Pseudomonadota bacterium]
MIPIIEIFIWATALFKTIETMFMESTLTRLDWTVLGIYALSIIFIGIITGRKEKNTEDFFLAGRHMPWWAVMISIYATALSALTFIGVPGVAYGGDFNYLQLGIGDFFGRIFIAFLLITAYYRGNVMTVYEFLGQRFGPCSHGAGTGFFIITRLLASGVRLAGCAIALSVVFGISIKSAIVIIAFTALLYTMVGGIKAVIWTDMVQFTLLLFAAFITIGTILVSLPNGWSDFIATGSAHQKFEIFHISLNPGTQDYWLNFGNSQSLIAGFLLGCFTTLAVLGTDQDLVQRMLTCEKVRESQKAIILTGFLNFPITLLFLSVGAALFVYYHVFPNPEVSQLMMAGKNDYIFPYFIKTVLAPGLRGLLIAGLLAAAMSSLDSALNALASTVYVDIYKKYMCRNGDEAQAVKISRWFVAAFAVMLALIALIFCRTESVLWLGFRVFGYTYGALLGIFLLAVLTKRRGSDRVNVVVMLSSVLVVIFLTAETVGPFAGVRILILKPFGITAFAWPWAIVIGMVWTFCISIMFSTKSKVT